MTDNAITRGGIGVLGSFFYICGACLTSRADRTIHKTIAQVRVKVMGKFGLRLFVRVWLARTQIPLMLVSD